ncbi:glycosyltransferase family 9 protein [Oxynema aestuarii]|jgi:ADP-heptose:LPS heptosyltransferase|uniref:Glycosyltransferase family 9 protein n=1 Tax=Oxynema aestuarii AP17 TaxID=2064643 RepID=A0A6H1U2L3_9CYAN|nr:glycosyltransferase family 9 protein [Oxynema aestuarii]QIZ72686.1 glycosyltransferase family 9 protein [Oxynema aestuarii AP17]RMH75306.1 MAG: lipopolysaccharide heptosyltransferase family protein [Cyanobacteria bacterium J007]
MRILALVPGGIGDQILFFPTLEDLKRSYPNARIDVIVEPRAKDAYRVCKFLHDKSLQVLPFDFVDRNGLADWGNLLGVVRDREYDAVISLERRPLFKVLLWLSGIPTRVGYRDLTFDDWFLNAAVERKTEQYLPLVNHDLLQGLGLNTPCPDLSVTLLKEDLNWAEAEQDRLGVKNSGYILAYGGSGSLCETQGSDGIYPVEQWQQIVEQIQQRQPQLPIVWIEEPENPELSQQLAGACPGLKVTSAPDLGKLAGMVAAANLMLCTDSVPLHLAVALQTYTIALFGPTTAKKRLPSPTDRGSDAEVRFLSIQSPTGKLADISPETVLDKVWGS